MLSGMLSNSSTYPTFNNPNYARAMAAANQLTGPRRYLAFARLAVQLAKDSAPIVAYGNDLSDEFFSPRIGCQTYTFYPGADLTALCLRPQHG